jgi:Bacterial protein of unknown function (Gcw_chp)
MGIVMKKVVLAATALAMISGSAFAADMPVKAIKAPPPPAFEPWDVAFGSAIMSDYVFRGITQSNHKPSVAAYFEPRYNVTKDLQLYVGTSAESISFPNRAAAEVDIYGGVRPTFGPVQFDFGGWYYWYPGGQCFNGSVAPVFGLDCLANGYLPINLNVIKKDLSFGEAYAKANVTVNDQFSWVAQVWYSPSVLNSGAHGTYASIGGKVTAPSTALPTGWGLYASGEVGYWWLGTSSNFYCTQVGIAGCTAPFPGGIPYKSYAVWNFGVGVTKSVFTLDFRYYQTNLNKGDCNAFTSDHTAQFTASFTAINPGGFGSNWCGASFVVSGKFDLTAMANLK